MQSGTILFLSKLATWLALPFSLAGLALLGVLLTGRVRGWGRVALALALLLLWGGGCRWTSESLVRSLERFSRPPEPGLQAEAIVVLGGFMQPALPPRRAVEISDAGDRALEAARLWREGRAPRLVVTGGPWDASQGPHSESSATAELLGFLGVPADAILHENRSRTTRENALEVKRLLAPLGIQRILLVTSALHMPRAAALFRAQGFEVIPAPTDFLVVEIGQRSFQLEVLTLLPNVDSLSLTTRALHEWMGMAVAAVLGWSD
ncbi:MAG: YdcF family protein [Myxococcota bacterium]